MTCSTNNHSARTWIVHREGAWRLQSSTREVLLSSNRGSDECCTPPVTKSVFRSCEPPSRVRQTRKP